MAKIQTKPQKKAAPAKKQPKAQEKAPAKVTQPKAQFVYYKTAKGFYNYRLVVSNGETLVVGGGTGYAALSGCKAGIESVRKTVGAHVEDLTLKKHEELPNPKFEIYLDKAEKYRYRLFARNGELLCNCEQGYASKDGCKKALESLAKWVKDAEIVAE
ncbi:MAG: DUF1508 domain-containing protein [Clostridia bacterium]|nr:DUF1508 domain-containing protein [Clostridia bacterium]